MFGFILAFFLLYSHFLYYLVCTHHDHWLLSPQAISSLPTTFKRWLHTLFFFFSVHAAWLMGSVSWPGIEAGPLAVRVQSRNHWPSREFPPEPFQWSVIEALLHELPHVLPSSTHSITYRFLHLPCLSSCQSRENWVLTPSYKLTILLLWNPDFLFPLWIDLHLSPASLSHQFLSLNELSFSFPRSNSMALCPPLYQLPLLSAYRNLPFTAAPNLLFLTPCHSLLLYWILLHILPWTSWLASAEKLIFCEGGLTSDFMHQSFTLPNSLSVLIETLLHLFWFSQNAYEILSL